MSTALSPSLVRARVNATASAWLVLHLSHSGTALGLNTALLSGASVI